ncbi:MAG: DUF6531 domain-containing protein, partial [Candidatus Eremiobacteraeota bacterium]|nr:DUF6531 domain-containing protein [Candidatus Eremiobacteraeota bacterium]
PRTPAIPERACGRCNGTTIGKPIDVATGEVWNEKTDLALSGPFGLSFTRFYGSQTAGSADLGSTNWLHTYAAALDVSSVGNGTVAYYDNRGMPYYFSGLAKGGSSYDNPSGSTLALSSDGTTFTLTTFSGETSTFNAAGQLLVLHDRIGNAQTVTRDASNGNRIASVADSLGRQLCFYYDVASRIVGVAAQMSVAACPTGVPASTTTTPVVILGYDTSTTNCSVNSLCAVTEPDGNTWTYQYSTDPNYPYNLSMVLDPLQDPEESNSFSGNRIAHQESGSCNGSSPCGDTGGYVNVVYPSAGSSTASITDGLGRTSTISYDPNTLLLTQISGPVCRCGGDQTRNYAYDASQRLTSESDDGVDGYVKHTTTYAYARDVGGQTFPGPTSVIETVDTAGTMRTTTLVYYPMADARHDLAQTITQPAVDQPNSTMTTSDTYSLSGLLLQRKKSGNVDGTPTAYTWNWTYDARGRILTQTSPRTDLTATTTFRYFPDTSADAAAAGQLRSVTDALNHSTQYASVPGYTSYTPFGDPQSITDPNGVSTEFAYDARGRLVSSTVLPSAEGDQSLVTQLKYDAAGRRTQQILPARNGLFFGYDTSNRLTQIIRADASLAAHERMLVTYNVFDQASTVAAQGCSVPSTVCSAWATTWSSAYVYSATTSDLAQVTNADDTAKKVTYTAQGALATLNDENHTTGNFGYAYDLAGRRLSETRVLAGVTGGVKTQYAYDLHDNVTSVTDPNGNVTTYHYDDFDRVTKETSPVS